MKKIKRNHFSGFTLVELLAVISILGIVGSLMFGILFSTLQGANKSDSLGILSQNGNFVMSQMARMIRSSSRLQAPTSCYSGSATPVIQSEITIQNPDGYNTTFACDINAGTVASNGANLLDPSGAVITACSFSCSQATSYDSPSMTISFTLAKKNSNTLVENNSVQSFQTTVTLRNTH